MWTSAIAVTARSFLYFATIAEYCLIAALKSPFTSSALIAALSWRSPSPVCAAASTAAIVPIRIRFIPSPPEARLASVLQDRSIAVSRFGHLFRVEPVPDAAHALQVFRLGGRGLDLLAQVRDLVVDYALGDRGFLAPHLVDQQAARQHAARTSGEQTHQLEFERRGGDRLCPAGQPGAAQNPPTQP